jgi:hypothetical protein
MDTLEDLGQRLVLGHGAGEIVEPEQRRREAFPALPGQIGRQGWHRMRKPPAKPDDGQQKKGRPVVLCTW